MTRGCEEEGFRGLWSLLLGCLVDACVGLLPYVRNFVATRPHAREEAREALFLAQDFALEPDVEGFLHNGHITSFALARASLTLA